MKVQSFLIALATMLFFVLSLEVLPGRGIASTDPRSIENDLLVMPKAAKFIPKQASLTIHWKIDFPNTPKYFEELKENNKNKETIETAKNLRDGLFALIGIDFDQDLSQWIGSEISFALFDSNETQTSAKWLLALGGVEKTGSKQFLDRFWLQKSLEGTILNIKSYKGVGLISGNENTNYGNSEKTATALINDEILLIASDRSTLENSLNASQFTDKNQFQDKTLKAQIEHLNEGLVLLTVSPKGLHSFLGLPTEIISSKDINGFISSLNFNEGNLFLDGVLEFKDPIQLEPRNINEGDSLSLIESEIGPAEGLAILYSPDKALKETNLDLISQWICTSVLNQLQGAKGVAAKTIVGLNKVALMWIKEPEGWVIGTKQGSPSITDVDDILKQDNQFKSDISIDNQEFQVWSKPISKKIKNNDSIEMELSLILDKEFDNNWWGENVAALQQRQKKGLGLRQKQLALVNPDNTIYPFLQLAVNEKQAQKLFHNWTQWRLLESVAGRSLNPILKGLALSINPNWDKDDSSINLRASVQID